MTDLSTDQPTVLSWIEPVPTPDPGDRHPGPPTGSASAGPTAAAVPLTRLIGLARLTPAQAVEIAAGVLAEAARSAAGGLGPGRILIRTDGTVGLVPAPGRPTIGGAAGGSTVAEVETLIAELVDSTRRGNRHPNPTGARLLGELDRARAELPVAGLPAAGQALAEARATVDGPAVQAELAALVAAIIGSREPAGTGAPVRGAPRTGGGVPRTGGAGRERPAGHRSSPGGSRAALRRIGAWLVSVAVLATIILLEVAVLSDKIVSDVDLLLDAGRAGTAAPGPQDPVGRPITPPAPAAAGPVTVVDLRALGTCAPGTPCPMRVLVRVLPGPQPQVVSWSFRVVNRCPGAPGPGGPIPGGGVTVPPGTEAATAVGSVALPPGPGVAVFAVTDQPAAAASQPVLVGSCESG